MKIRTILLTALVLMGLAACSLAEDVTPPPGYVAPTLALTSTSIPPTSTPVPPTATLSPTVTEVSASPEAASVSVTPEVPVSPEATLPAGTTPDATSVTPETTGTAGIPTGAVTGTIISGSGGAIPADLIVTLRGFDMPQDQTSNPTEAIHLPGTVQPDGSYTFENVEIPSGRIFLTEVTYNGVPFQSGYVAADQAPVSLPALTIYEVTQDTSVLNVEQVHIALDYSTADVVQIIELYIMSNTSQQAVLVPTDGTSIPFVQIPAEGTNVNYQVASGSATFIGTDTGFALVPLPAEQKYGLVATFDLPYQKKITLTQPFILPIATVTIFAPEGVKIGGKGLTDKGLQDLNGTSYHLYEAANVAAGTSLTVTLSGQPKTTTSTTTTGSAPSSTQKWLIIGLGTGGMALVGVGLFLFMRDRKRSMEEDEEEEDGDLDEQEETTSEVKDTPEEDRETILDAIIALDDQYKAGGISREVYDKRRTELKERLKG